MRFARFTIHLRVLRAQFTPEQRRDIFCLGDSHVCVWNYVDMLAGFVDRRFVPYAVPGATALGLANPNSRTDAFNQFRRILTKLPHRTNVVVNIGEVDCGFLIWFLAQRTGTPVAEYFGRALDSYKAFLEKAAEMGHLITVVAAPLPTLPDAAEGTFGEVSAARSAVKVPRKDRTDLTIRWNRTLEKFCEDRGFRFLATDSWLLNPQTGQIRDIYMNPNPADHHLDQHNYALALRLAVAESRSFLEPVRD